MLSSNNVMAAATHVNVLFALGAAETLHHQFDHLRFDLLGVNVDEKSVQRQLVAVVLKLVIAEVQRHCRHHAASIPAF